MALIGSPQHRGGTLYVEGVDNPGAGQTIIELDDIQQFNEFTFQIATGPTDVLVSLDGVNFSIPITVQAKNSVNRDVWGSAQTGPNIYYFFGNFKAIRIRQIGAGPTNGVRLICGKIARN